MLCMFYLFYMDKSFLQKVLKLIRRKYKHF